MALKVVSSSLTIHPNFFGSIFHISTLTSFYKGLRRKSQSSLFLGSLFCFLSFKIWVCYWTLGCRLKSYIYCLPQKEKTILIERVFYLWKCDSSIFVTFFFFLLSILLSLWACTQLIERYLARRRLRVWSLPGPPISLWENKNDSCTWMDYI